MKHIHFCEVCKKHTIKTNCCNNPTSNVKPPRYLQSETIKKYRRKAKNVEN